jgi:TnpA family transposase
MPRRSILTATERENLLGWPEAQAELIRHYTLSATDLAIIRQHRGAANRLGYAVQLCSMRYPGVALGTREEPFFPLLETVATQLKVPVENWNEYGQRAETRREHALELQALFGFKAFTRRHYREGVRSLEDVAWHTDKGIVLASALLEEYRRQQVLLPTLSNIERICAEAVTRANRRIYTALTGSLTDVHRMQLDALLRLRDNTNTTLLGWLRQSPARPNSRYMLEHIERLRTLQALDLPNGIERQIHQNRLLKIAREGGQMTPADLAKFEPHRRYATLVAVAVEGTATVTDEIIDLHDRITGKMFNAAKHKHQEQFQSSGKAINDKVRLYGQVGQALIEAKRLGADPFAAIESVLPWEAFTSSVSDAQKLARPEDFDFLHRIGESYATLRRYAPEFLEVLKFRAAPAAEGVLKVIGVLRDMNAENSRKIPVDAPIDFIKKRWEKLVLTEGGVDRSATVKAIGDCVVACLSETDLERIANKYPKMWHQFARELARRLLERNRSIAQARERIRVRMPVSGSTNCEMCSTRCGTWHAVVVRGA